MTLHRSIAPVCAMAALLCVSFNARGGEQSEPPATNLALIRSLALRVGETVGAAVAGRDSVSIGVTVLPKESAWYVESAVLQGLAKCPFLFSEGRGGVLVAEFGIGSAGVEYTDIRRDGFFGTKLIDRKVTLMISAKVVDSRSGTILLAKDYQEETQDTIPVDAVADVESPHLPLTRGAVPPEGLFTNAVEPAVTLGAIAVAVYLLFSVRN